MADADAFQRRVRRRIKTDTASIDLAADVNVVVSHGDDASSTSRQNVVIRQGKTASRRRDRPSAEEDKE